MGAGNCNGGRCERDAACVGELCPFSPLSGGDPQENAYIGAQLGYAPACDCEEYQNGYIAGLDDMEEEDDE